MSLSSHVIYLEWVPAASHFVCLSSATCFTLILCFLNTRNRLSRNSYVFWPGILGVHRHSTYHQKCCLCIWTQYWNTITTTLRQWLHGRLYILWRDGKPGIIIYISVFWPRGALNRGRAFISKFVAKGVVGKCRFTNTGAPVPSDAIRVLDHGPSGAARRRTLSGPLHRSHLWSYFENDPSRSAAPA